MLPSKSKGSNQVLQLDLEEKHMSVEHLAAHVNIKLEIL